MTTNRTKISESFANRIIAAGPRVWQFLDDAGRVAVEACQSAYVARESVALETLLAAERALDGALRIAPAPAQAPVPAPTTDDVSARIRAFFVAHGKKVPALSRPERAGILAHLEGRAELPRRIAALIAVA